MTDKSADKPKDEQKTPYKDTMFLPNTAFPMRGGLPRRWAGILGRGWADARPSRKSVRSRWRTRADSHSGNDHAGLNAISHTCPSGS